MNPGKSALKAFAGPWPASAAIVRFPSTAPSSHYLARFSAFFHSPAFLARCLLYCITTRPGHLIDFFFCLMLHTVGPLFLSQPLHVVRTCTPGLQSHPIAEPLVPRRPTRVFSPSLYRPRVHVVRFCPTFCPTTQPSAQIDWLTYGISSTPRSFAIGIGQPTPLLFGSGMHRPDWLSCTS